MRDLTDRAEVVAAWSPTAAGRSAFAARTGLPVAETVEAVLDDPGIDLVFVLSPPWSHLPLVERCAARGKHVLLEKPIEATMTPEEAAVAAELRAKGAFVIGFGGPGDITKTVDDHPIVRALEILPALQILGERVAEARGIDTTAPRHLSKVVILG